MQPEKKKRGFAALSPERLREIASSGGIARKRAIDQSRERTRQGGQRGEARSLSAPAR